MKITKEKQNQTAKSMAYILRWLKLTSYYATKLFIIFYVILQININEIGLVFGIAVVFLTLEYWKDSHNIRGFVDGKFREKISNNTN